jgi:hypothetical protein
MRRSEARRGESASPAPAAWKREEEARGGRGYPGRILARFTMLVRMYRVHEWLDGCIEEWVGGRSRGTCQLGQAAADVA